MSNVSVHTGLWFDLSYGHVRGATLTIPISRGSFLITALTVLVGWAAVNTWKITSFLLHQFRVKDPGMDPLDLELQVLLRNSTSAFDTLLETIKMQFAWLKKTPLLTRRILLLALPAFLIWILFTAASIAVAGIASRPYKEVQVLAKKGNCGFLNYGDFNTTDQATAFSTKLLTDTIDGRAYARSWYGDGSSSAPARSIFPVSQLPYNHSDAEPCPFPGNGRCLPAGNTALLMDTGNLDSHIHFGINAAKSDRVTYRKRVVCAPVSVEEFIEAPIQLGTEFLEVIFMGAQGSNNFTFSWNNHTILDGVGYQLR
jgi:hypothetical protein